MVEVPQDWNAFMAKVHQDRLATEQQLIAHKQAEQAAASPARKAGKQTKYPLATMNVGDTIEVPLSIVPDQSLRKFKVFLSNKGWALEMKFKATLINETIWVERIA